MAKTICLCASVTFYPHLIAVEKEVQKAGYLTLIPLTAEKVKRNKKYNAEGHKTWLSNPADYHKKTFLIQHHFSKITQSDGILVVNDEKHGLKGYIGGNVLMEMTVAFLQQKPIFILNPIDENLSIKEEVYGLNPRFLGGDPAKLEFI